MTTSAEKQQFLAEIIEGEPIPKGKLSYFRTRLSNKLHEAVLDLFETLENEKRFTKADLARRIGKDPAQITRWFGEPGNWEFETVSDLLLGMGCELNISARSLVEKMTPVDLAVERKKPDDSALEQSYTSAASPQLKLVRGESALASLLNKKQPSSRSLLDMAA